MSGIRSGTGAEHRAARRTNLMLAAEIELNGVRSPVRIRNLSETGALIECAVPPDKGAAIVMHRATFHIGATVAWSGGGRCGIHFDQPISLSQWTGKALPPESSNLRDQRRVDALQAQARAAPAAPLIPPPPTSGGSRSEEERLNLRARLADELAYVRRLLDAMGDELATEAIVVAHHSRTLQNIDLAGQILAHLSSVVSADDPVGAVERIGMEDLKARLKRKPLV